MNLKFSTHLTKQKLVHQSSVLIRIKNLQLIQYDLEFSLSNTQLIMYLMSILQPVANLLIGTFSSRHQYM